MSRRRRCRGTTVTTHGALSTIDFDTLPSISCEIAPTPRFPTTTRSTCSRSAMLTMASAGSPWSESGRMSSPLLWNNRAGRSPAVLIQIKCESPAQTPWDHPCTASFPRLPALGHVRGDGMKALIVLAAVGGSLICAQAHAQERAGSAVIGAVSGAIILGPLGAVAGALVGYTAGPEMARGLRAEQPHARSRVRRAARTDDGTKRAAAGRKAVNSIAASRPSSTPAPAVTSAVAKAPASISATQPLPPVQVFE
jgi:hypothetical protein